MKVIEPLEGEQGKENGMWRLELDNMMSPALPCTFSGIFFFQAKPSFLKTQRLQTIGFCFEGFGMFFGEDTGFEFSPTLIHGSFSTLNISQTASIIYKPPFEKTCFQNLGPHSQKHIECPSRMTFLSAGKSQPARGQHHWS